MANEPVLACVVATGMMVDGVDVNDVDDVGNVVPVVGTPVADVVNAGADYTTIMQPRCIS